MISAVVAACWVLLSLVLGPPALFSGHAPAAAPALQCLHCGLYLMVPCVFIFFLLRRQVRQLDQMRERLKNADDAFERRLRSETAGLEKAMADIKTLKGITTICANCKNIRNGEGRWETVESYIERHTETRFSHGLCSDCRDVLYGEDYSRYKTAQAD